MKVQTIVQNIIVIGSSAGGPRILKEIFYQMPKLNSSVILVQHMPKFINESLKRSIAQNTEIKLKIAEDGDILENNKMYIAPSEQHLILINNQQIHLFNSEKVNYVCPSVDVTMLSLRKKLGNKIIGVILSGMGKDGTDGIVHIKKLNGTTIAQNQETSVIFGMPKEAITTGCVDWILPPGSIRTKLIELTGVLPD